MTWIPFTDSDTIPNGSAIRVTYEYQAPQVAPEKCGNATAHIDSDTKELTFTCDDLGTCTGECSPIKIDNGDDTFSIVCNCSN